MDASFPMNNEYHLVGIRIDIYYYLFNERTDNPLLQTHVGFGRLPGTHQVFC